MNGFKSYRVERRILGKSLSSIHTHDFKAEDFLFDLGRQSGMKRRVERMLVEEAFGFGGQESVRLLGIGGRSREFMRGEAERRRKSSCRHGGGTEMACYCPEGTSIQCKYIFYGNFVEDDWLRLDFEDCFCLGEESAQRPQTFLVGFITFYLCFISGADTIPIHIHFLKLGQYYLI